MTRDKDADWEAETSAQINALWFMVELIFANGFVSMTSGDADRFVAEVKRVSRRTWLRETPPDVDAALASAQRSTELIARLLDNAAGRAVGGRR